VRCWLLIAGVTVGAVCAVYAVHSCHTPFQHDCCVRLKERLHQHIWRPTTVPAQPHSHHPPLGLNLTFCCCNPDSVLR
jgi:hypothetical protein